eukprot:COSAG02_NODE_2080_length_9901_cov_103.580086_6_plen_634_part_00
MTDAEASRAVPLTLARCRYNPSAEETKQFWIAQGYSEPALDDLALVAKENSGKPSGLRRWYTDTPCWRKTSAQSRRRTSASHGCSEIIENQSNVTNDQGCDDGGAVPIVCQECNSAETKVELIPIGQWFCSKCANLEAEQCGVPHTIPSAVKIGDPNFQSSGLQRRFECFLESPSGGSLSHSTVKKYSIELKRLIAGHKQLEHVGLIVGTALWSSSDDANNYAKLRAVADAKLTEKSSCAFRWFQKFMGSNRMDEARGQALDVTSDMVSTDAVTGSSSGDLLNEAPDKAANASSATELNGDQMSRIDARTCADPFEIDHSLDLHTAEGSTKRAQMILEEGAVHGNDGDPGLPAGSIVAPNERAHRQAQLVTSAADQREAIECSEKDEDSDDIRAGIAPQRAAECDIEADSTNMDIGVKTQNRKAYVHQTAAKDVVCTTESAREPENMAGPKSQLLNMSRYALEAHARAEPFSIDHSLINKLPATKEGRTTIVQMILTKQAEFDKQQQDQQRDQQQDQHDQQQDQQDQQQDHDQQQRTSALGECDAVCSPAKVAKNCRKRKSRSEGIVEGGELRQGNSEHAARRSAKRRGRRITLVDDEEEEVDESDTELIEEENLYETTDDESNESDATVDCN